MMHWLWYTLPVVYFPGLERLLGGSCPPVLEQLPWRRPLAVAAHPDDLEYFCGGTLATLARTGAEVTAVLATRGERGGAPDQRAREQQEAASLLGYSSLRLFDYPDRGVRADDPRLQEGLADVIRQTVPDVLLTFDTAAPFPIYHHSDHMAVARAVLGLWSGPTLQFHTRRPNLSVDITPVFADKVRAFAAHRSQLPRRGLERLVAWHLGRPYARRERQYIELFHLADAKEPYSL